MSTRHIYPLRIGYKVVQERTPVGEDTPKFLSALSHSLDCVANGLEGKKKKILSLVVEYKVGEIVHPKLEAKGTRLFAFKNLEDAREYAGGTSNARIFRAECHNCYEDSALSDVVDLKILKLFFSPQGFEGTKAEEWADSSYGVTLLSEGIKLLEQVPNNA